MYDTNIASNTLSGEKKMKLPYYLLRFTNSENYTIELKKEKVTDIYFEWDKCIELIDETNGNYSLELYKVYNEDLGNEGRELIGSKIRQEKIETKIEGSIDEILANAMKEINSREKELNLDDLKKKFKIAMENIVKNGSDELFRFKNKNNDKKRPLNMSLFESVVYLFVLALERGMEIDIQKLENFKKDEFDKPERITFGIDSMDNIKFRFDSMERLLND